MMSMAYVMPARLLFIRFSAARLNLSSVWLRQELMGTGAVDDGRTGRSSRSPWPSPVRLSRLHRHQDATPEGRSGEVRGGGRSP